MDIIKIIRDCRKATLLAGKYLINSWPSRWQMIYVIENANWSTDWDGWQITRELNKMNLLKAKTDTYPLGFRNKIIHLGSLPVFPKIKQVHKSNKVVLTVFHIGEKHWPQIEQIKNNLSQISKIHTSCLETKNKLLSNGVPAEKISVIPLGVNLNIFKPASINDKILIKEKLNLPTDKIIIGSFQKDGNGWADGAQPKLIKGPDIFCDAVIELAKIFPVHVLLSGPARGYVKNRLGEAGIPHTHEYLTDYNDIVPYWQALDLYLITSRIEGGPKAIFEAWATGVPLVSTKVGMVPDLAQNGESAILTEVEDTQAIIAGAEQILNNKELREKLTVNGLNEVQKYSWEKIAERYYKELYSPII